jgi:large subunit ribosomal protein L18
MNSKAAERVARRRRRHAHVRKKVRGTAERPRLVIFRSLRHVEGQLVDDDRGVTLLGVSTRATAVRQAIADSGEEATGKTGESYSAGKMLAERAREAGVEQIVFDRGGYRYHGRVQAFADGARAGGLRF